MCGMKVVVVNSDENGNIDLTDLKAKALKHKDTLVRLLFLHFYRIRSSLSCNLTFLPLIICIPLPYLLNHPLCLFVLSCIDIFSLPYFSNSLFCLLYLLTHSFFLSLSRSLSLFLSLSLSVFLFLSLTCPHTLHNILQYT